MRNTPYPGEQNMWDRGLQGVGGMFGGLGQARQGLSPYSNRLMLAGMGLMSGKNAGEGWEGAMKGLVAGSALDTDRKRERALQGVMNDKESGLLSGLSEAERAYVASDPEAARELMAARLKGPDYSDAFKNYQMSGYPGTFFEYQKALKDSGVSVSVGAQETAGAKATGELFAKRYSSILDAGDASYDTINNLDIMQQAASDPNIYTGVGGETVNQLKATGNALGFNVQGTDSAQVLQSFSRQMTMRLRNPESGGGLPGAVSNSDRQWLQSIPPSLTDTPETLNRKFEIMRKLETRKQELAQLASQYAESSPTGQLDNGWERYKRQWVEEHPLFDREAPFTAGAGAEFTVEP